MGTSDKPAATVHPGAVRAIFDHLLLSLTADGEPGPPVFLFSHYRFRWAATASSASWRSSSSSAAVVRSGSS